MLDAERRELMKRDGSYRNMVCAMRAHSAHGEHAGSFQPALHPFFSPLTHTTTRTHPPCCGQNHRARPLVSDVRFRLTESFALNLSSRRSSHCFSSLTNPTTCTHPNHRARPLLCTRRGTAAATQREPSQPSPWPTSSGPTSRV